MSQTELENKTEQKKNTQKTKKNESLTDQSPFQSNYVQLVFKIFSVFEPSYLTFNIFRQA